MFLHPKKFSLLNEHMYDRRLRIAIFLFLVPALFAENNSPDIKVYFSPHGGCTEAVVCAVKGAQRQILVEAYSFTSEPIAIALIEAERRGVDVEVILDKSQEQARGTEADLIIESGIPTYTDSAYRIAHDKVMIIDGTRVITGSFNFTKSAEDFNAENLLVISNDPPLAEQYTASWRQHLAQSHPFHPGKSHHKHGSHSRYYGPLGVREMEPTG
jgi:phosphatidylserine/phosphatidylglycerophosphate/cardiolipin synthase-like enzyme